MPFYQPNPDRFVGDLDYIRAWLRHLGGALAKGRRVKVEALADGHAMEQVEYPSMAELEDAAREKDALIAITLEDASAIDEDELRRIVVDYHRGDDGE